MFNNKGSKAKSSKINKKKETETKGKKWVGTRARAKFDDKSDKHLTKGNAADWEGFVFWHILCVCTYVCLFCPLFHIADVSFDYLFVSQSFRLMFEVSSIFMNIENVPFYQFNYRVYIWIAKSTNRFWPKYSTKGYRSTNNWADQPLTEN